MPYRQVHHIVANGQNCQSNQRHCGYKPDLLHLSSAEPSNPPNERRTGILILAAIIVRCTLHPDATIQDVLSANRILSKLSPGRDRLNWREIPIELIEPKTL